MRTSVSGGMCSTPSALLSARAPTCCECVSEMKATRMLSRGLSCRPRCHELTSRRSTGMAPSCGWHSSHVAAAELSYLAATGARIDAAASASGLFACVRASESACAAVETTAQSDSYDMSWNPDFDKLGTVSSPPVVTSILLLAPEILSSGQPAEPVIAPFSSSSSKAPAPSVRADAAWMLFA